MATITVNVDDEIYKRFRKLASDEHNGKKGFLGDAITETMKQHVLCVEQTAAKQRLLVKIRRGYKLGVWKNGFNRDELYDRE